MTRGANGIGLVTNSAAANGAIAKAQTQKVKNRKTRGSIGGRRRRQAVYTAQAAQPQRTNASPKLSLSVRDVATSARKTITITPIIDSATPRSCGVEGRSPNTVELIRSTKAGIVACRR